MNTVTKGLLSLAAVAALAACAVSPPQSRIPAGAFPPRAPAGTFASRLVAAHNRERAAVRALPLVWDATLAGGASAYAQRLAASAAFAHSDRRARPGIGENLWMGTRGGFTLEQMVGNWSSEKRWFRPGIFPNVSTSGNWSQVGHYSQIVWPATTRVGCGLARGRGRDVLVCRYAPAGNIDGRRLP